MRVSPVRILDQYVDGYGNLSVAVAIGKGEDQRLLGASARPLTVARFLRELAADIERLA